MLEYWIANNESTSNDSVFEIDGVLQDPGSAILFGGYPPWLLYFAAGSCVVFMLIGIPGNLITIAALFRTKKIRNATAVFIMNLSISDLMFCCFNLPLATSTFWYSSWMHGPLLCRLFPLLRYGLLAVSLFTVLSITINRYIMIGHPRLYPKLYKPKYLILMVLATWTSGFGALIATWFERWGRFGLDPSIGSCTILPDINGHSPKEFLFILAFLTPCIAIVVCYARIFYIVRRTARKSRRREKVTTDLVKASLQVKFRKTFEDSAIGCSSGQTTTTTTTTTTTIDNNSMKLNSQFANSLIDDKCINLNFQRMDNIIEKIDDPTIDSMKIDKDKKNPIINNKLIKSKNLKINNSIIKNNKDIVIPSFSIIDNDDDKIVDKKKINYDNNGLQVPHKFIRDLQYSSEHLLTPLSTKYDAPEISEEFISSRSDSPIDKRFDKRSNLLRRESRFRSIKIRNNNSNNNYESGKMTAKDKKLLKMILVIFTSFLICYLPITITKTLKDKIDWRGLNIAGYILIYLTTCINPVIYVVMSSEYRSAYKNVLLCRNEKIIDTKKRVK